MAATVDGQNELNGLLLEERNIVASLAELQVLHEKLQHLRDLLPGHILEPLHDAYLTAPNVPPERNSPQEAYSRLITTTKRGFEQVEEFRNMWQSNNMEQARKRAKVEDIGQGDDAFRENYRNTLAVFKRREEETKKLSRAKERDFDPNENTSDQDPPKVILERWQARKGKGEVQVELENINEDGMAFDLKTGGLEFSVMSTTKDSTRRWSVHSRKDTQCTGRKAGALQCLGARKNQKSLGYLLDMLESYRNIFGGQDGRCDACGKILGWGSGDVPFVRRRKKVTDAAGKPTYSWGTYHEEQSCWAFRNGGKPLE